jgi:hypothetical protein
MASRDLHPMIVIFSILASFQFAHILNYWVVFALIALYYVKILYEVTQVVSSSLSSHRSSW